MAWRPAYQPQVPQTTCGSFADEQFGQRLRAGAASFQLEARRLRDFILLVFFLGTAIAGYLNTRGPSEDSASVVETQVVERRPRGSTTSTVWPQSPALRSAPHSGHRPAQSSRHSGAIGRPSRTVS